jgi:potassium-transporting ATPase KdpC subunit
MLRDIKRGARFTLITMLMFGFGCHAALWAVGRLLFPHQAGGSLIRGADGRVVGSTLIAQKFERPDYFHPRPSAVDYNGASTGGSNFGPSNPDHLKAVRDRLNGIIAHEGVPADRVPSVMVTTSGSGVDPHIRPEAADIQIARIARARGVDPSRVRALAVQHIEPPTLGFLGRSRVNVLRLNLALDEGFGRPPSVAR